MQKTDPSPNYDIDERFARPDTAPEKAQVIGWPFQLAQKRDWDPLKATNDIEDTFPRRDDAPSAPAVVNWPTRQEIYSQSQLAQRQEPSPDYGFKERFDRPDVAPTTEEVIGWPTRKQVWSLAQKRDWDPLKATNDIEDTFPRRDNAPTAPAVVNWPTRQEIYAPLNPSIPQVAEFSQRRVNDDDIAKTEHVNQEVYDFVNRVMPPVNEIVRERGAPR
jgi:hypothetical protein